MKKLLTVLALIAFTSSAMAATSRIESFVNKTIAPVTNAEKNFNSNVEAQQKAAEKRQAEIKKQQEANKKALEKKQAEIKKQQEAQKKAVEAKKTETTSKINFYKKSAKDTKANTKKAVENEKNFWKNLFK